MRKSELLAAEAVSCLNKSLCHLKDIWEQIGIPEDQRLQRTTVVKNHIRGLLEMMIKEEESLMQRLMSSIQTCRTDMKKLCQELQRPPFEEEEGISILQQEKNLRTRMEALVQEKSVRMQQLKSLMEQDQDLCDILCSEPYGICADTVPSVQQLEDLQQHISNQQEEKVRRHAEFTDLRKQIIVHMEQLEHTPETSFEKDVVCEDDNSFCLSTDNITALKLLLCQLEQRQAELKSTCECVRAQVHQLWERLQVSQEHKEAFRDHMVSSRRRNLEVLKVELQRLEELKLLHIRSHIDAVRSEIAVLWDKCFFNSEQRQAFTPYFSEECTEDLLQFHSAELQRLQQHYEQHTELFEGVQRWEESWRLFLDLEKKATDPNRFMNRGGNLLKEEKQRTELHKSLPKLQKKLKAQIESWEMEQGQEFLVNGVKFLQYVEEQVELHQQEKENQKLERQLKKNKQMEEDMMYGTTVRTPTKRRFMGTPGQCKPRKMMNATSSSSTSTVQSGGGAIVCRSPVTRPPLSSNKGPSVRTPTRGKPCQLLPLPQLHGGELKENKAQLKATTPQGGAPVGRASPQRHCSITSVASTYSEFVRDLSEASNAKVQHNVLNSTNM